MYAELQNKAIKQREKLQFPLVCLILIEIQWSKLRSAPPLFLSFSTNDFRQGRVRIMPWIRFISSIRHSKIREKPMASSRQKASMNGVSSRECSLCNLPLAVNLTTAEGISVGVWAPELLLESSEDIETSQIPKYVPKWWPLGFLIGLRINHPLVRQIRGYFLLPYKSQFILGIWLNCDNFNTGFLVSVP